MELESLIIAIDNNDKGNDMEQITLHNKIYIKQGTEVDALFKGISFYGTYKKNRGKKVKTIFFFNLQGKLEKHLTDNGHGLFFGNCSIVNNKKYYQVLSNEQLYNPEPDSKLKTIIENVFNKQQ